MKPWADLACLAILLAANSIGWFFDAGIQLFHSDPDPRAGMAREWI